MGKTISFFSTCPKCRNARLQNGYTRVELVRLLDADRPIDAHCVMCDALWPISAMDRFLLTKAITADQHDRVPPAQGDQRTQRRQHE